MMPLGRCNIKRCLPTERSGACTCQDAWGERRARHDSYRLMDYDASLIRDNGSLFRGYGLASGILQVESH